MQIKFDSKFETNFNIIFEYIAQDKILAANRFRRELLKKIKKLSQFPYKFRQSIYFDEENVRDMVFKEYTVVYEIDLENNFIIILNIFNKSQPLIK